MPENNDLVILYSILFLATLTGLGMAIYALRFKAIFPPYREWLGMKITVCLGTVTLVLSNAFPIGFFVIASNVCLCVAHLLLWAFTRKLMARHFNFRYSLYLAPLYIIAIIYFFYIENNVTVRVFISSALFFIFSLGAVCELFLLKHKVKYNYALILLILVLFVNAAKWCYYILTAPFVSAHTTTFLEIKNLWDGCGYFNSRNLSNHSRLTHYL